MRVNWKMDEDAVKTIDRLGLTWEQTQVPAQAIDVMKSRLNHARVTAIIEQNVEDYREAMERGDIFPMIVAVRKGNGKYVIAGGNHRHAAALEIGVTEFECIVSECGDREFELLCPALNMYVGQREDRTVRTRQAAEAVLRLGISITQAANDYQVTVKNMSNVVYELRAAIEVRKQGHNPGQMSAGHLRAIYPIIGDAVLFPLMCELSKTKIGKEEIREAIKEMKALPNEAARISAMTNRIRQARQITVGGRIIKTPTRNTINRSVSSLVANIKEGATECALQMTRDELRTVHQKLTNVVKVLAGIAATRG